LHAPNGPRATEAGRLVADAKAGAQRELETAQDVPMGAATIGFQHS
jgi:hypothetical protein